MRTRTSVAAFRCDYCSMSLSISASALDKRRAKRKSRRQAETTIRGQDFNGWNPAAHGDVNPLTLNGLATLPPNRESYASGEYYERSSDCRGGGWRDYRRGASDQREGHRAIHPHLEYVGPGAVGLANRPEAVAGLIEPAESAAGTFPRSDYPIHTQVGTFASSR
jgi:hypothetical protein